MGRGYSDKYTTRRENSSQSFTATATLVSIASAIFTYDRSRTLEAEQDYIIIIIIIMCSKSQPERKGSLTYSSTFYNFFLHSTELLMHASSTLLRCFLFTAKYCYTYTSITIPTRVLLHPSLLSIYLFVFHFFLIRTRRIMYCKKHLLAPTRSGYYQHYDYEWWCTFSRDTLVCIVIYSLSKEDAVLYLAI